MRVLSAGEKNVGQLARENCTPVYALPLLPCLDSYIGSSYVRFGRFLHQRAEHALPDRRRRPTRRCPGLRRTLCRGRALGMPTPLSSLPSVQNGVPEP